MFHAANCSLITLFVVYKCAKLIDDYLFGKKSKRESLTEKRYIYMYINNSPLFVSKISVHNVVSCRNTVLCFNISITRII